MIRLLLQILLNFMLIIISLLIIVVALPFRLVIGLIRKIFGIPPKPRPVPVSDAEDLEMSTRVEGDMATLNVNLDRLNLDEQKEFVDTTPDQSEFRMFEGHVKHGYDLKAVSDKETCPRCQAPTEQMYANFVYATNTAPRLMFVPAGYFCQKCPTVIVDQNLIRGGVSRGFKFGGVLGIDRNRGADLDGFDTWNGKKAVYLIDEKKDMVSLTTVDQAPEDYVSVKALQDSRQYLKKKREKTRKRNKLAKHARKQNRRKK